LNLYIDIIFAATNIRVSFRCLTCQLCEKHVT